MQGIVVFIWTAIAIILVLLAIVTASRGITRNKGTRAAGDRGGSAASFGGGGADSSNDGHSGGSGDGGGGGGDGG